MDIKAQVESDSQGMDSNPKLFKVRLNTRLVFVVAVVVIDAVDVVTLDPVLVPGHARDAFLSLLVIFPEIRLFVSGLSPANL